MRLQNSRKAQPLSNTGVHIWTVVSLVEDRICSSIHLSEYHAYSEAVSRFETAEPYSDVQILELQRLLKTSHARGDYHPVRQYIKDNACKLHLLQFAEHDVDTSMVADLMMSNRAQNRTLHRKNT